MMPRKVFILERDPPDISRLARAIRVREDLSLCGSAANLEEALEGCAAAEPDLLVVDLAANGSDEAGLVRRFHSAHPHVSILALCSSTEPGAVERILRAGAIGCIARDGASDEIPRALDHVLDGDLYLSERLAIGLLERLLSGLSASEEARIRMLSERESEVFRLLGEGWRSLEIAERLGIGVKTVDTYRERIKEKLGLADFRKLYHFAIRWAVRGAGDDPPR
jgi:DNA-binding NarL/FixJ family response regulator